MFPLFPGDKMIIKDIDMYISDGLPTAIFSCNPLLHDLYPNYMGVLYFQGYSVIVDLGRVCNTLLTVNYRFTENAL